MASNVEGKELREERLRRRRECNSYRLRRASLLYDVQTHLYRLVRCKEWARNRHASMNMTEREEN